MKVAFHEFLDPTVQGLKEELLEVVVVNNTNPQTKTDWIYFKQHRMAEMMIAANQWAARRNNETTWFPTQWSSIRLDAGPPNSTERISHPTGREPLLGGKPGMMNFSLPNDPPVTWTEDGRQLRKSDDVSNVEAQSIMPTIVQTAETQGTILEGPQTPMIGMLIDTGATGRHVQPACPLYHLFPKKQYHEPRKIRFLDGTTATLVTKYVEAKLDLGKGLKIAT
ncbi:hypothetical protein TREMEDRAFT_58016 [Tremella mesenterica DSM 1558]|uniref:uncharacterized protein n=1 Tax=Tremella mesenterica (strain ATCC 24925 / CBS 8224 / DSM 1558 / NBRC 9311 / NRRL Y-6157 / RJB 2259-6 / UBC 559-6) TaxID=578456 RepID=UPI0003F4A4F2|nr:uncharacterized protein TREMEDRAFT_58016 [Tremella mesenterica DSM 1558]EIW71890.1 hypothetical protein TREMEDRAFT_58016 [Tremella mesenterica DSM 1558]